MRRSVGFNADVSEIELMDQQVLEERRKHPEIPFTRADFIRRATLRELAANTPVKVRERRRETVHSGAAA